MEQNLKRVLILEDDVDFEPKFKNNLRLLLDETETLKLDWDLMYVLKYLCSTPMYASLSLCCGPII